jgi:type IV pilus assembly protein PilE
LPKSGQLMPGSVFLIYEALMSLRMKNQIRSLSANGFTLIELMIVIAVIGILSAIAYPNYTQYVLKAHRNTAQGDLLQLAGIQEKIFLNSNSYSPKENIANAYNGTSAGGLGVHASLLNDGGNGRYTLSMTHSAACNGAATPCTDFVVIATPVTGQSKDDFGIMSLASNGTKTRNVGEAGKVKTNW